MEHVVSSSTGALCAEIITLPLCTVKTNKILHNDKSIPWHFKNIYTHRGIGGFYNASVPAILSQVISVTSKFSFYRIIQRERKTEKSDIVNNMFNGAFSGLIGGIFSHPFDVMRVMKQKCEEHPDNEKFRMRYMYRGYTMNAIKSFSLGAMIYPSFDFFNSKFNNMYIASIMTSVTTSCIIYPIENLKIKRMCTGKKYIFDRNVRNYYGGFLLHNLRCIPNFLIFNAMTEKVKNYLFM